MHYDESLNGLIRKHVEFLRLAALMIQEGKFSRVIVKLYKEIKGSDNPRGLRIDEMAFALNRDWSTMGRLIIRKTADPQVFIIRFSQGSDFATAIFSNPNRVHGKFLSMRIYNGDENINKIDFNEQDVYIEFTLKSDLGSKRICCKEGNEKVGYVMSLLGPLSKKGDYTSHVLVDLSKALVHQIKIILLKGRDKETIKLRIFYICIPHGTCREYWYVDHIGSKCEARIEEYRRHFPRIFINEDEEETLGQPKKQDKSVENLVEAATTLRIYESQLDKYEHMSRGIKRRRIGVEGEDSEDKNNGKEMSKEKGNKNNSDKRIITAEDLRKALKGKSPIIDNTSMEENAKKEQ
ncbi:hypothetical protein MKW92_047169, partial [Papaver armeniacum]